jgi:glycosyltransferase involved in cell wall biosynthesis
MISEMIISIVIPTYNEEHDIAGTIQSLLDQDYPYKEILILDDSTDNTPDIVHKYNNKDVTLVRPGGGGRCEARNKGIMMAKGEVVCILNADVRPRPNFLTKIVEHYKSGADYLLVQANISNKDALFARYVDSFHNYRFTFNPGDDLYTTLKFMEWTEGFSCRRDLAIKAGLFPTGFPVPIVAGEDGFFGAGLRKSGANKKIDFSIVVDHVAPASFSEYWYIRTGRGKGSPQIHRFLHGWSYFRIILWAALKIGRTFLYVVMLIPMLSICWRIANKSARGKRDLLPFCWAWLIEHIAFHVGECKSIVEIYRAEQRLNCGG